MGGLFLEVGSTILVRRELVFCRNFTHNSRVRRPGAQKAVEEPRSDLGHQWTSYLRMFDGLSLPGAAKHLATPAVNQGDGVRRAERWPPSRLRFHHVAQGPDLGHKPRYEQTDQAPQHNLTNSFEPDFNPG